MYPGPKIHYPSRRHLGRGQFPTAIGVAVTITFSGSTATLTFARPIVVTGVLPLTVTGLTLVTQTVVSPTVVTQLFSGPLINLTYLLTSGTKAAQTNQGGPIEGTYGTFGTPTPPGSSIIAVTDLGGGSYDVQFNSPVATFTASLIDFHVAFYSSSYGTWLPATITANPSADVLTFHTTPFTTGCIFLTLAITPQYFTLATPVQVPQTHSIP
jgi:hypothetical protein